MTTFEGDAFRAGLTAALETFRERRARHACADPDTAAGQYQLGAADAYGDAIGLLEEFVADVPAPRGAWPEQTDQNPHDLEIGEKR